MSSGWLPHEFEASPSVQAWIRGATPEKRDALTSVLVILKDHPLPGGSVLKITEHKDPSELPAGFNVPFRNGTCLLLYEIPIRAEDPITLVLILDPDLDSS